MKKINAWIRFAALALSLAMVLTLLPLPTERITARAAGAYGKTTANGVRVRKQPSTDADYWFRIDMGYVCQLLETTTSRGVTWYKVNVEHPDDGNTRTYVGYIHGDYFTPLTDEEAAAWEKNPVQPGKTSTGTTTAPSAGSGTAAGNTTASAGAMGQITNGGVNFRETEGGSVIQKLDRGTVVELLSIPATIDDNHWYRVRYNGREGYIQAPFIKVVSGGASSVTPTPTTAAGAGMAAGGYVKLVLSSANLRLTPGGKVAAQWEKTGEVIAVRGNAVQAEGYTWYPVQYAGGAYYVRGDCVQVVSGPNGGSAATPTPTATAASAYGYIKTVKNNVNLRLKPAGDYIQQVSNGVVLAILAPVTVQGGYGWYYVSVGNVKGYLRGDCVQVCDASGNALTVATPTPAATNAASSYGYIRLTQDKVNLRNKPAGSSIEQLPLNQILPMVGAAVKSGNYTWYPVRATSGKTGYVRGDCATLTSQSGENITPTPAPANTTSANGYAMVTQKSTNLRKTPGGNKVGTVEKNSVWPMTGQVKSSGGYSWYPVNVNGTTGYVRGDCAFKLSATQEASYLAGNGVPNENGNNGGTAPASSSYVITTLDKVNLRVSASKDASAPYNVALGTVMAYNTTATVGGSLWYRVVYSNTEVWVLGSCVKVMTSAEYQAWLATKPSATPQPEVIKGYIRTTASGVNLRTEPNGANIIGRIDKGVVLAYSKDPVVARNYTWYYVKTSQGYGYLRGDCVTVCQQDGSDIATPAPTSTSTDGKPEATYTTLRRGSTGTAVKALVSELKNQGYYTGNITSSYTSAVEEAVKRFQLAKGLTVDGIAGKNTQHALFGTVEPGTNTGSNLSMAIYPAEKIDWYTGGIQQLWPKGANYKVYDVKTGIVWWAHRWSGGNHVDAEPLTAADTARLCKIYGVSSADQIASKNLWQRRPMLVTIGTRTFACSLYGIPHNYPQGDTISNNNFKGQLCIHFTNSKTHTSNKVDTYHTEAIQYAIDHAPNGHR